MNFGEMRPPRSVGLLTQGVVTQEFGPKGEGADNVYDVPSSFDRAAQRNTSRRSASFGSSDRFNAPGSYLKISDNTTGPHASHHGTAACPGRLTAFILFRVRVFQGLCVWGGVDVCARAGARVPCVGQLQKSTVALWAVFSLQAPYTVLLLHVRLQDRGTTTPASARAPRRARGRHLRGAWAPRRAGRMVGCSSRWGRAPMWHTTSRASSTRFVVTSHHRQQHVRMRVRS